MNADRLLAHYEKIADAPDAIARLRRFIVDLAVRGKLVAQDPNDGSAPDLLRVIATGKARLLKVGEIRKSRKDADMSADHPYDLPEKWLWVPFGELHNLVRGVTYSKADVSESASAGFVPILRANNIGSTLTHDDPIYVKAARVKPAQFLRRGDYMIALSSGSKNLVGKAALVSDNLDEAFGGFCGAVRVFNPALVGFTGVFLRSDLYRESISAGSRGIGINNLKTEVLANLHFPLPPLAEQHRIVAKVDELMALCDRLEAARTSREAVRDRLAAACLSRLNSPDPEMFQADASFVLDALPALTSRPDQIKALRRTILNLAVRGKLVTQDLSDEPASELLKRIAAEKEQLVRAGVLKVERREKAPSSPQAPFELPSGWTWARLQSLCLTISDGDHQAPPKSATGVPFLVIGDVKTKIINYDAERKVEQGYFDGLDPVRKPRPGDILYTLVGSFGIPAPVLTDEPFCVQRHIGILRPARDVNQLALALFLESELAFKQAEQAATGIAQKTVSLAGLRSMLIPVPPLEEQRRILVRVKGLMTLCDKLEAAIARADSDRARLLEGLLDEALDPSPLAEAA